MLLLLVAMNKCNSTDIFNYIKFVGKIKLSVLWNYLYEISFITIFKNTVQLFWYRNIYFSNATISDSFTLVPACHIWIINFDLYSSHTEEIWFTWTYLMHYISECYSCLQNSKIIFPFFYSLVRVVLRNSHIWFPYRYFPKYKIRSIFLNIKWKMTAYLYNNVIFPSLYYLVQSLKYSFII